MVHSLSKELIEPYLGWIKTGQKKYEGRLMTKVYEWNLFPGFKIHFYDPLNNESWVDVEVVNLHLLDDFGSAYDMFGDELISNSDRNSVITLYNDLYHYSGEVMSEFWKGEVSKMIKDNRVVAIEVRVLAYV
jgi:ASC-1-like (ASCH) protein